MTKIFQPGLYRVKHPHWDAVFSFFATEKTITDACKGLQGGCNSIGVCDFPKGTTVFVLKVKQVATFRLINFITPMQYGWCAVHTGNEFELLEKFS